MNSLCRGDTGELEWLFKFQDRLPPGFPAPSQCALMQATLLNEEEYDRHLAGHCAGTGKMPVLLGWDDQA